jgi:hypothetical protein
MMPSLRASLLPILHASLGRPRRALDRLLPLRWHGPEFADGELLRSRSGWCRRWQGCRCRGYLCASSSTSTSCDCSWGQIEGDPATSTLTDACTGTYCCQLPAITNLGGECNCGDTPCPNGAMQVPQCNMSAPCCVRAWPNAKPMFTRPRVVGKFEIGVRKLRLGARG